MKFIEDGKVIEKEQDEQSKKCNHKIMSTTISETRYRHCENCGMLAHEDGSFDYLCWSEWCRCMQ